MKRMYSFLALAAILLVSACSPSTRITSAWKAPDVTTRQYNKIAVVGIIREADRTLRERMENQLTSELRGLGYNAFSAYERYGPKAFQNESEEQVNQQLRAENVDAVLTVVLLDKDRERNYVPDRFFHTPYFMHHNMFWWYYNSLNHRIASPGYYEVRTRYFWESNLYDLQGQQLVYSVQTQTFDPASVSAMADAYSGLIVQNMVKKGILQTGAGEPVAAR